MQAFEQLEVYRRRKDAAFYWGGLFLLAALAVLLMGFPAWAQDASSPAIADPTTQQLLELVKLAGGAFRAGEYLAGAIAVIIALVFAIRLFGKKLHELIPDDSWADKPFFFLFDTKPGGVLLNAFSAAGVVLTPLLMSGQKMTPVLAGTTLLAGIGASALWGWVKDLGAWWSDRKKPSSATAQAAGLEATKQPGSGVDA